MTTNYPINVLITGGAGFIGSHLAKRLALQGDQVTLLDNLSEQVHGKNARFPRHLTAIAKCVRGDICEKETLAQELENAEAVVHLAAETGTAQSMYEIQRYERVNLGGTANLLDLLVKHRPRKLRKIIVASSRAIYGEGKYRCESHGEVYPKARTSEAMSLGHFEPRCPHCDKTVQTRPTTEDAPFAPSSFYGLTKQVQEQMVLMFATSIGIDACALRYQNVYGPGQSLRNSYTGLLAVFSNRVRQGKPLKIFEDGRESRDFVYIDDVIDATVSCLSADVRGVQALNIGSGVRVSVLEVAQAVQLFYGSNIPVDITGEFRVGDIRHNAADITRLTALTGFRPRWSFRDGLSEFLSWATKHDTTEAGFERSLVELKAHGLLREVR